ncbi:hypothetical protein [Micromonospora sp. B006]|uniref:hypothetical protein n=1 Tax=Micromonospora sp. B006 TaxID=2201999 RepID=UPI001CEF94CF|nr:hypothetical protein [Micromonospora sp. B006]
MAAPPLPYPRNHTVEIDDNPRDGAEEASAARVEMRWARYRDEVIPSCPDCHAADVPLLFGLPAPEARKAAAAGELALGGCFIPEEPVPNWQCPRQHRWHDADERTWNTQLLAALLAHGYTERDHDA